MTAIEAEPRDPIAHERGLILDLIAEVGQAWRARRFEELSRYFHEAMVIGAPGQTLTLIQGREACIEAYRDLLDGAEIETYAEEPAWVGVWGATAVASYAWVMTFSDEDGAHAAAGNDVLTLAKGPHGWRVVGRMLLETSRT